MTAYTSSRSGKDDAPRPVRLGTDPEFRRAEPGDLVYEMAPAHKKPELADRRGVWIHSFVCNLDGLHFNLYSWLPDRHTAATVFCPECGQHEGKFRHYRTQTNEAAGVEQGRASLRSGHPGEVYRHCPGPAFSVMSDSTTRGLRRVKLTRVPGGER